MELSEGLLGQCNGRLEWAFGTKSMDNLGPLCSLHKGDVILVSYQSQNLNILIIQ